MAIESHVLVCGGSACSSSGSNQIVAEFKKEFEAQGIAGKVEILQTGCLGFCEQGPIVKIMPQGTFYVHVKPEDVKEIVVRLIYRAAHLINTSKSVCVIYRAVILNLQNAAFRFVSTQKGR